MAGCIFARRFVALWWPFCTGVCYGATACSQPLTFLAMLLGAPHCICDDVDSRRPRAQPTQHQMHGQFWLALVRSPEQHDEHTQ